MARTLQADGITKDYPTRRGSLSVLRDVSLSQSTGEAAVITGPSGSGKSTLLNILGTLEPPSEGRVTIDGCDPFTLSEVRLAEFRNRRIGFIFQEHHLLPHCSVLENVLLPTLARANGDHEKDHIERSRELLDRVGLSDRLDHRPAELSGGERQRVAVARSLINRPLVVLADEPTGNLDRATAQKVATLMLEMYREENAILIAVTHSASLAAAFERQYELVDGVLRIL